MKIGGWKTRSVHSVRHRRHQRYRQRYGRLGKKTGTLLKNDGTSMEPDAQLAQLSGRSPGSGNFLFSLDSGAESGS
jgi:hypothetical protein